MTMACTAYWFVVVVTPAVTGMNENAGRKGQQCTVVLYTAEHSALTVFSMHNVCSVEH